MREESRFAVGLDLGGTKLEAQLFDPAWRCVSIRRIPTARNYQTLIADVVDLVTWADQTAGQEVLLGFGSAGLVHPRSGVVTAANLPTHGQTTAADLRVATGRDVTLINDAQAFALSEAMFGAGRAQDTFYGLILGTGVSGAYVAHKAIHRGHTGVAGEIGHLAAPAHLVEAYDLPLLPSDHGPPGSFESLIGAAGLSHIAQKVMQAAHTPQELAALRSQDPQAEKVWDIWCALVADLLVTLTRTFDPACFVLGGGLSDIAGVEDDLSTALAAAQFAGFETTPILLAEGGATSGARGAAYAAVNALGQHG